MEELKLNAARTLMFCVYTSLIAMLIYKVYTSYNPNKKKIITTVKTEYKFSEPVDYAEKKLDRSKLCYYDRLYDKTE